MNIAFDSGSSHILSRVQRQPVYLQGAHHHPLVKQRPQQHVHHHSAHMGDRVLLSGHRVMGLHEERSLHLKVERKGETHMINGHRLAGSLRQAGSDLPHHPVLDRRDIK